MNPQAEEGIFIDYTNHLSQYLVWVPERKEVIKATNSIFVEDDDDQQLPEQPKILNLSELGGAQCGKAQQIENADKNAAENSSSSDDDDDHRTEQQPPSQPMITRSG